MKVLFCIERDHPGLEASPYHYCMVGALEAMYKHAVRFCYYDGLDEPEPKLLAVVREWQPDLIVATALLQREHRNVPPETYEAIIDVTKTPVIMLWTESAENVVEWADQYAPKTTATVFVDTAEHWKQFTKFPEKCHWVPEPKDPRVFNDPKRMRDLPVTFIGSVLERWDRAFALAFCLASNVNVKWFGGLADKKTSLDAYAYFLQSSAITLNFTSAVTFQHINGRTSEATMCGALLLESESPETPRLLEPYKEFVPFCSPFHIDEVTQQLIARPGDLVEKLQFYMGPGQAEAKQIAAAGQRRAMELFDGKMFWAKLFELAGLT
jgi:hypothetical protein